MCTTRARARTRVSPRVIRGHSDARVPSCSRFTPDFPFRPTFAAAHVREREWPETFFETFFVGLLASRTDLSMIYRESSEIRE